MIKVRENGVYVSLGTFGTFAAVSTIFALGVFAGAYFF